MKINTVFSSCYLPPIAYFHLLSNEKITTIDSNEFFVKQTLRNRCQIYGANGIQNLIVPTEKRNSKILMKNVKISNHEDWQKNHWRSIESAYRKSPFFEHYEHYFMDFYLKKKHERLVDFNMDLLKIIIGIIGLNVELLSSREYLQPANELLDFRSLFTGKPGKLITKQSPYIQVFSDKHGFQSKLSIIDLLFNEGPNSLNYIKQQVSVELS